MPPLDLDGDPPDTRTAIMQATYRALCEHGYADLTIQRIGDEFEKSKSLLYHHYESKDELLLEFLSFMLEEFESDVEGDADEEAVGADEECEDPEACLHRILDHVLDPAPDAERADFRRAMAELRAQAAHDERYREYFTRHDRVFCDQLAETIKAGIEDGTFREADPGSVAEYLHALLVGSMARQATTDGIDMEAIRAEVDAYIDARLQRGER